MTDFILEILLLECQWRKEEDGIGE